MHYHARDKTGRGNVGRIDGCPVVLALGYTHDRAPLASNAAQERYRHLVLPERYGETQRCPRSRRSICAGVKAGGKSDDKPEGEQLDLAAARERHRGDHGARRAGADFSQPARLCPADPVPRLRTPLWMPQLLGPGSSDHPLPPRPRLSPLRPCRAPAQRPARPAARWMHWPPAGRVWSASRKEGRDAFSPQARHHPVERFPLAARSACAVSLPISPRACDIVIGTQIVAKGHNFPGMNAGGVDRMPISGFRQGIRARAERTFQLLLQSPGRSGAAREAGGPLVQTYQPEHPVIAALILGRCRALLHAGDRDRRPRRAAALRAPLPLAD